MTTIPIFISSFILYVDHWSSQSKALGCFWMLNALFMLISAVLVSAVTLRYTRIGRLRYCNPCSISAGGTLYWTLWLMLSSNYDQALIHWKLHKCRQPSRTSLLEYMLEYMSPNVCKAVKPLSTILPSLQHMFLQWIITFTSPVMPPRA